MTGAGLSFCSSAFLVRPPDEMGTREHYQRAQRVEFTTRCWQLYLAKAGPALGEAFPWSAGLTQCSRRDGFSDRNDGRLGGGRTVEEYPLRTFWCRVGRTQHVEASARRSRRRRFESTAIWRAAVAQSAALRCTLGWRRSLSRAIDADRSRRLPLSPCQTNPITSDLKRAGVSLDAPVEVNK